MSEGEIGWQEELRIDHRRHLRSAALVSLALHGVVFAALTVAPSPSIPPLPQVLSVELVAAPPGPARVPAAGPKPKPAPRAEPQPAPAPVPAPPPPPKAQVEVLPEQAPVRVEKVVPPEPKPVPDPPKPKPAPKVEPKPAPRPEPAPELSYEEAMASLDDELGVDETSELLAPSTEKTPERSDAADSTAGGREQATGTFVSPELAAWSRATRRRIQSVWVTPPSFRGRGLVTHLEIRLAASGEVLGEPRVVRSSGDPYFDDNAVRAVLRASPLPPPPQPGAQDFLFRSEAN